MITVLTSTTCIIQHYSTKLITIQFSDLSKTYWKVCIVQYIIRISNLLLGDRVKQLYDRPISGWFSVLFLYFRWRVRVHFYYVGEINTRFTFMFERKLETLDHDTDKLFCYDLYRMLWNSLYFRRHLCYFIVTESYNKIFKFTAGNDMIKKVQEIQTVGGENRDCPEFAVAGMLNGQFVYIHYLYFKCYYKNVHTKLY